MPILLLLAGVVILVGVVTVAMGHGGEMAEFAMDYLPPDVTTAADVATLRPPSALWGYNAQVTDEALGRIAQVITERDVEIAVLRQQLAELRSATGAHPAITATLLARAKAATARRDTPGLDVPPHGPAGAITPEPGSGAGSADSGSACTGSVPTGSAGTGSVPTGSAPAGSGDTGSVPRSEEAAASRDD